MERDVKPWVVLQMESARKIFQQTTVLGLIEILSLKAQNKKYPVH